MSKKFDIEKPYRTRSGCVVNITQFKNKLMGIVMLNAEDGEFCSWMHNGKVYYGEESHDYDLVNVDE